MTSPARPGRGRPRDVAVDRAILEAVADLLVTHGFDGVTMEEVARRAGVSKASVYRRHPSRADLLTAVCLEFSPPVGDPPDTGSLRGDLRELLGSLAVTVGAHDAGRVLPALLAASAGHAEARDAIAGFAAARRSRTREVLARGVRRGELDGATDPDALTDLLVGAVVYRTLVRGGQVDAGLIERYLDAALGCRPQPGGASRASSPTETVPPRTTSA